MKIVFAGGMTTSARILEVLCQRGHTPSYVFGYPPTLAGRSNYISFEPLAEIYGFPLINTDNINDPKIQNLLSEIKPDWFMVFGWSQLVKPPLLAIPRQGTLGFHMSPLPVGRGRAPIAWTLIKGMNYLTASLIWLKAGADDGEIAIQKSLPLSLTDDASTAVEKAGDLACEIIEMALPLLENGSLPKTPQDDRYATYWEKRSPKDGLINWDFSLNDLYNFIRGVTFPFPGAFSYLNNEKILILECGRLELEFHETPGKVLGPYYGHGNGGDYGMAVAVRGGVLILKQIQRADGFSCKGDALAQLAQVWKGALFGAI